MTDTRETLTPEQVDALEKLGKSETTTGAWLSRNTILALLAQARRVAALEAELATLRGEKEALEKRLTDDRLRAMFKAACEAGNEAFNHYQHQDYNDAECRAACDEAERETLKAEILAALGLSEECPTCGRSLAGSFPLCIDCQIVEALKNGDAPTPPASKETP